MIIIITKIIFQKHHLISLITIILTALFLYTICVVFCLKCINMYQNWKESKSQTIRNMEDNFLENRKILNLKDDCIICLEILEGAIELKCKHVFHRHCIDQMIEYSIIKCPLCRGDMT